MLFLPPSSGQKLSRYWFILVEDKTQLALVFFRNEDTYIARERNEGFIRVDDSLAINVVGDHSGYKHVFTVKKPNAVHVFIPESRYVCVSIYLSCVSVFVAACVCL